MNASDLDNAVAAIGVDHLPDSLDPDGRALVAIFAKQICDGQNRSSDPYFTNDRGHNVGRDVLTAATIAADQLKDLPEEPADKVLARLIERLQVAEAAFKNAHSDPDGYGVATFGELERDLLVLVASRDRERSLNAPAPTKFYHWAIKLFGSVAGRMQRKPMASRRRRPDNLRRDRE